MIDEQESRRRPRVPAWLLTLLRGAKNRLSTQRAINAAVAAASAVALTVALVAINQDVPEVPSLDDLERQMADVQARGGNLEREATQLKDRLDDLQGVLDEPDSTPEQIRMATARVSAEVEDVRNEVAGAAADAARLAADAAELAGRSDARIDAVEGGLAMAAQSLGELRDDVDSAATLAGEAAETAAVAASTASAAAEDAAQAEQVAAGASEAARQVADDLSTLRDDVTALRDSLNETQTDLSELIARVDVLHDNLADEIAARQAADAAAEEQISALDDELGVVDEMLPRTAVMPNVTAMAGQTVTSEEVTITMPGDGSEVEMRYRLAVSPNSVQCESAAFERYYPAHEAWAGMRTVPIDGHQSEFAYTNTAAFPTGVAIRFRVQITAGAGTCGVIAPSVTLQRLP